MAKILVIEDDPKTIKLLTDVLEHAGHSLLLAGNGELGVKLAQDGMPDIILMDLQLPVKDGLTATREIKATPKTKHIPIIALTALAMKSDEERALTAGCDGYIAKPVSIKYLLDKINCYLGEEKS